MADMLSQEEINALLNGSDLFQDDDAAAKLSSEETDALGEVGNISMGTAATTLFTLLNQKVTITTPRVTETAVGELEKDFVEPCVLIFIKYIEGIEGFNLLILQEKDVKIITDLMMGGDGTNLADELTDLHLSAISEAMNQMIGSASTSLSEMLGQRIDISPPEAHYESIEEIDLASYQIDKSDALVKIAFKMTVGDLIDSEIMQVMPLSVAQQLVTSLIEASESSVVSEPDQQETSVGAEMHEQQYEPVQQPQQQPQYGQPQQQQQYGQPQYQQPQQQPQYGQPQYQQPQYQQQPRQHVNPVNVQPLEFQDFNQPQNFGAYGSDISLISDVPLGITVELGRTSKQIQEILEFGIGTVIELDKLVGDSLDILANGKKIAKGEVVVVDESYGIRITDIVMDKKRLENL